MNQKMIKAVQPISPDNVDNEPPAKRYSYGHVYSKMKRKVKELKH